MPKDVINGLGIAWALWNERVPVSATLCPVPTVYIHSYKENGDIKHARALGWIPLKGFLNPKWHNHRLMLMGNFTRSTVPANLPLYNDTDATFNDRYSFPACCGAFLYFPLGLQREVRDGYASIVYGKGNFKPSRTCTLIYTTDKMSLWLLSAKREKDV